MGQGKLIRIIYNANAGFIHPVNIVKRLISYYFPRNLCEVELVFTERKGHATQIADDAVEKGCEIIVAVGGDGTINEVARALVNSDVWMGIVPMGSGNGLARSLGIPLNLIRAFHIIATGPIRTIDVGRVNNNYFFATAGFGLDAMIGKRFDEGKIRGAAPYYIAGIKEFFTFEPSNYEIQFNNRTLKMKAILVAVANVRQYGINATIAPKAKPDDGLLDLCIVRGDKLLPAIVHLPKLFTGQIDKAPYVELYQSRAFKVIRDKSEIYQIDGEVVQEKEREMEVTIEPQALKIIVRDIKF